jgi:hypothetical protein
MAERKCVPCLRKFDTLMRSLRLAEASIGDKVKFRADVHLTHADASLSGMKEQECVDPEFLDYMKSHVREARRDVDKQNWDKAAWRTRVVQGGMLDTAFIYLIEHCAKERE